MRLTAWMYASMLPSWPGNIDWAASASEPADSALAGVGLSVFGRVRAWLTKKLLWNQGQTPVSNEIPWVILALPQYEC
ncbi:hypothetical protein BCEN4_2650002 [Burkholderia cenocepacia]|nr:hypothetical protein BCEN4_2650002 [Burkholderia cenocepacia]